MELIKEIFSLLKELLINLYTPATEEIYIYILKTLNFPSVPSPKYLKG